MITKDTKISDLTPDGYEFDSIFNNNGSSNIEIFTKTIRFKKKKTAEEIANKLGFKIGDKICNLKDKTYLGIIEKFYLNSNNDLYVSTNTLYSFILHDPANNILYCTNKIAINCIDIEDFKFMYSFTKEKFPNISREPNFIGASISLLDYYSNIDYYINKKFVILTIDEYMESIGQKPLFITHDKIKIWNPEQIVYYNYIGDNKIHKTNARYINISSQDQFRLFSTDKAINEYLKIFEPKNEDIIDMLINNVKVSLPSNSIIYLTNSTEFKAIKVFEYVNYNNTNNIFFIDKELALKYHLSEYKKFLENENK